jgi:hypothetical protein
MLTPLRRKPRTAARRTRSVRCAPVQRHTLAQAPRHPLVIFAAALGERTDACVRDDGLAGITRCSSDTLPARALRRRVLAPQASPACTLRCARMPHALAARPPPRAAPWTSP